jgi:DNA-directed RNA polymerase subunit beta
MPYMADGTPVDVVLNPLGVPSRMNVGQILETHPRLGARGVGQQVQALPRRARTAGLEAPRGAQEEYDDPAIGRVLDGASEDAILSLARNVEGGIHVSTAVFDGAGRARDQDRARTLEAPDSGQMVLFDGRTGEPFDNDVTVGVHLHAEAAPPRGRQDPRASIGPYSLVTQQPLGGKAQFGGQRSARWRCGRSRPTAPRTACRSS